MTNKAQVTGEAIIWIYRFILIAAVSFALIVVVSAKYGEKYDVRGIESKLLSNKVIDCITSFKDTSELDKDSLSNCLSLNKMDYFVEVNITSFDLNVISKYGSNFVKSIEIGNVNLKETCRMLEQGIKVTKTPSCLDSGYFIILNNENMAVKMKVGIAKYDENQ